MCDWPSLRSFDRIQIEWVKCQHEVNMVPLCNAECYSYAQHNSLVCRASDRYNPTGRSLRSRLGTRRAIPERPSNATNTRVVLTIKCIQLWFESCCHNDIYIHHVNCRGQSLFLKTGHTFIDWRVNRFYMEISKQRKLICLAYINCMKYWTTNKNFLMNPFYASQLVCKFGSPISWFLVSKCECLISIVRICF